MLANDAELMDGLWNSLVIGLGVVCLAVPVGLAGADRDDADLLARARRSTI